MIIKVVAFAIKGDGGIRCKNCNIREEFEKNARVVLFEFRTYVGQSGVLWCSSMNAFNGASVHSCTRRLYWVCPKHGEVEPDQKMTGRSRQQNPRRSKVEYTEVCPECQVEVQRRYKAVTLSDPR